MSAVHYMALACDYDGTLASDGRVDGATLDALDRLQKSGRKLILVTGRELEDLGRIFPEMTRFDHIVAENGALLYRPAEKEAKPLGEPPPPAFVETLRRKNVAPLSVGHVIVATREPQETRVLETIRDLGLEMQIIFNKGAVMVLPSGINKATGLEAALNELRLSPHNVAGIGDAENDHAFLRLCGCSAAVENALPMIKETADIVTAGARGAGVRELIDQIVQDDLAGVERLKHRHRVVLGEGEDGNLVYLPMRDTNVLLTGTSGAGKSTLCSGVLERLLEQNYQFCIIDPEGDYERFEGALVIGDSAQPPSADKVMDALEQADRSVIVNLLALELADRPRFFAELLPNLQQLRNRTARPHWIVVDEAHHMLSPEWRLAGEMSSQWTGTFLVTVHPDKVAAAVLKAVDTLIVLGKALDEAVASFRRQVGWPMAEELPRAEPGEALLFLCEANRPPQRMRVIPPKGEHQRHVRKYAEGKLGDDKSFYFRGPDGKLNLRAHNLELFVQMADGIDDETWMHHLRAGDYSRWFREAIKDDDLGAEAAAIEAQVLDPGESRARIREAVEKRYTGAA